MGYSDWQLNRIRDALRAFRQYTHVEDLDYYEHHGEKEKKKRSSLVKSFTWADVREAIAVVTGVEIGKDMKKGAERLRQFVEGINDKENPGQKRFPVPQQESLDGIVRFLTDEHTNLLSEDELKEYAPHYQAPMRLLEYLAQDFDRERLMPPEKIAGTYELRTLEDEVFVVRELVLQRPSEDGLIQVIETEDSFKGEASKEFDGWSYLDRRQKRDGYERHGGWAILTPENNLFCFLKNERTTTNRYYFTLASDLEHRSETPPIQLVFLHHDYSLELTGQEIGSMDAVMEQTAKNIIGFRRVEQ
ncbi:MAG: hypothetical protein AB2552_17520 [Candidatus Thiodiazotropha endolucinida]